MTYEANINGMKATARPLVYKPVGGFYQKHMRRFFFIVVWHDGSESHLFPNPLITRGKDVINEVADRYITALGFTRTEAN